MDIFGAYSMFSKPLWILRNYYNRAVISIQRQLKHRETQILFHLSADFGVSDFWFPKMWLFWGEVAFLLNSQMSWLKCVSIKMWIFNICVNLISRLTQCQKMMVKAKMEVIFHKNSFGAFHICFMENSRREYNMSWYGRVSVKL